MKEKKKVENLNQKIIEGIEEIKKAIKPEDKKEEKDSKDFPLQSEIKTLLDLCQKKYFYLISSAFFAFLFTYTIYFDLYQYDKFLQQINPKSDKIQEHKENLNKLKDDQDSTKTYLISYKNQKIKEDSKIKALSKLLSKTSISKFLKKDNINTISCIELKEKYLDELLQLQKDDKYKDLFITEKKLTGKYEWLYNRCRKKIVLTIIDNVLFRKQNINKTQQALLVYQSINNELDKALENYAAIEKKINDIEHKISNNYYIMEEKNDSIEKLKKEKNEYFTHSKGVMQIIEKSANFHGVSLPRIVLMPLLPFTVLAFYIWFLVHFDRIRVLLSRYKENYQPIEFPWFVLYDTMPTRIIAALSFFIPFFIACGSCYLHYYVYNNYMDTIKLIMTVFPGYVVIICAIPVLMTALFTAWTFFIWYRLISTKKRNQYNT